MDSDALPLLGLDPRMGFFPPTRFQQCVGYINGTFTAAFQMQLFLWAAVCLFHLAIFIIRFGLRLSSSILGKFDHHVQKMTGRAMVYFEHQSNG
jgi:hypothetical protein